MRRAAAACLALLLAGPAPASEFFTLKGHGGPVMGIAVEPGTGRIATASFDNSVGLWDGATPQWLDGHRAAVNTVLFLPDGRLASAGDDFALTLWDPANDAPGKRLEGHQGKVMGLALSPDGSTIASASWDGRIGLWPVGGGDPRWLTGHEAGVNAVTFLPDGQRLLSASVDGTIRLWDVTAGEELRQLVRHGFGVNEIVLGPGAEWLAYGAVDGVTRVVETATGAPMADFTLERRPILALAHHQGQQRLAVGDGEGYIMVVDTAAWRIVNDFRASLRGPVWALAFSPDGTSVHAGGLDSALYSWPLDRMDGEAAIAADQPSYLRAPEEMSNGERQFARKCSICHSLTPGSARRAGPTLHGVFGRQAGTVPDYAYSSTLSGSDIIWTEETIAALFEEGPDHYIPGSKMPMQRINARSDRDDLVAYLRSATAPKAGEERDEK